MQVFVINTARPSLRWVILHKGVVICWQHDGTLIRSPSVRAADVPGILERGTWKEVFDHGLDPGLVPIPGLPSPSESRNPRVLRTLNVGRQ